MEVSQVDNVINAVEAGWNVLAVAVPTRALRVIGEDAGLKFRVEQLNPNDWSWRPVSTHSGDKHFESFGPAIQDMITKQARLKEKIKLSMHEAKMARIKAENPTP